MDDDNDFGADADFLAALASSDVSAGPRIRQPLPQKITQPTPQVISQPKPQRLDRAPPTSDTPTGSTVIQPTPQALGSKSTGSSILVSPRQKGNPILTNLRSFAWEYSDIPADYVLGLTTCALFLSLKYHRLHPEYIYNRIRGLQGRYNLRMILTMVDIGNHEESLKELSKTSLVNQVTVILCWSASEAARYIELYKSYEHANASAIRGVESRGYAEKMEDFVTVPRSINKTDAVSLVSAFGSIRAAVNARPEEIGVLGGWGEKKVNKWCSVVDEPFRVRNAAKKVLSRQETTQDDEVAEGPLDRALPLSRVPLREMSSSGTREHEVPINPLPVSETLDALPAAGHRDPHADDEEALNAADFEEETQNQRQRVSERTRKDEELSGGVAAALAKLRDKT